MNNRNTWAPETWLLLLITSRRKKRSESDKTHCSQTLSTARVSSLYVQKMLRGWARLRELESSNHPAYRQTVTTRPLSYSHTVLGHLSSSCLQTFCLKKTWLISQGQLKWKNKKTKLSILLFCLHSNPHLEISFLRGLAGGSFRDWVMVQAQSRTAALGGSSIWPLGPLPREVVLGLAIWEQTPGRTKDMLEKLYPLGRPGNASGLSQRSWWKWMKRGISLLLYWDSGPHDLDRDERWITEGNRGSGVILPTLVTLQDEVLIMCY